MYFVTDACSMAGACVARPLSIFIPEARAIDVDQGIKVEQVVGALDRIASVRGSPRGIREGNVLGGEAMARFSQQVSTRRQ